MIIATYTPAKSSISITPLVDVVFILLLFFMLTSSFQVESHLVLNSSQQQSANSTTTIKKHYLQLASAGQVILNNQPYLLSDHALRAQLQTIQLSQEQLIVQADGQLSMQELVTYFDLFAQLQLAKMKLIPSRQP